MHTHTLTYAVVSIPLANPRDGNKPSEPLERCWEKPGKGYILSFCSLWSSHWLNAAKRQEGKGAYGYSYHKRGFQHTEQGGDERRKQALGKERVKLIKKKKKLKITQKIQKSGHLLKSEKVRIQKGYMGWGYFLIRRLTKWLFVL